jgi:hypothetical protein
MALTPEQQAMDFNPELQDVSRQRKLAELLMSQGMQQPQGQMISGQYVAPSWAQQLNPMANILAGQAIGERADTKQAQMATALRTQGDAAVQKVMATFKQNPQLGVQEAAKLQQYPQVKALLPQLAKSLEIPTSIQEFNYAEQNPAFAGYQMGLKKATAPNIINQVGASLAGQAGDLFKESKATAAVGYNAITSADKILNSTNKSITGPLANARLTGLQLADTLGVTGKGEKEKLAATREVLQETGKLALSAPPKGQGQVSNYERDLYQRAASGDINFTPTELNLIAKRAKEFGEYQIQQHKDLLQAGAELGPDVAKVAKLYQVTPPPSVAPKQTAKPSNVRSLADEILGIK